MGRSPSGSTPIPPFTTRSLPGLMGPLPFGFNSDPSVHHSVAPGVTPPLGDPDTPRTAAIGVPSACHEYVCLGKLRVQRRRSGIGP
jgi:hypothetical protein